MPFCIENPQANICFGTQFVRQFPFLIKINYYPFLQVLVIDKGQIVERGTHKDLLASEGVYKKLVLRQLSTSQGASVVDVEGFDPDHLETGELPIDEEEES